jgi:5-methylcytosine-specific restriction endonuclease McrA
MLAGSRCEKCGEVISKSFHADHKRAFVNGGKTVLQNGQALCAGCNQRKGVKHDTD